MEDMWDERYGGLGDEKWGIEGKIAAPPQLPSPRGEKSGKSHIDIK